MTNSIDYILAVSPTRDELIERLIGGYEERRAITRLVNIAREQILNGSEISFENNIWKAGTVVLDLNAATADDPSFFGLIAHVFRLCFDGEYAQGFENAVNSIGNAYEAHSYRQQLSTYQAEKGTHAGLMQANRDALIEIIPKVSAAIGTSMAEQRKAEAKIAYLQSGLRLSSTAYTRLLPLDLQLMMDPNNPEILRRFAEIAFDCQLAKDSVEEKQMVSKISTPMQRNTVLADRKQLYDAEIQVQEKAKAELDAATAMADSFLSPESKDLASQYEALKNAQATLEARDKFLDQEIARLKALVP